jgi:hypothetical protein
VAAIFTSGTTVTPRETKRHDESSIRSACRDMRQQQRLFAHENPRLIRSPNSSDLRDSKDRDVIVDPSKKEK